MNHSQALDTIRAELDLYKRGYVGAACWTCAYMQARECGVFSPFDCPRVRELEEEKTSIIPNTTDGEYGMDMRKVTKEQFEQFLAQIPEPFEVIEERDAEYWYDSYRVNGREVAFTSYRDGEAAYAIVG